MFCARLAQRAAIACSINSGDHIKRNIMSSSFYGCYLLQSRNPDAKGRSYIGFTVDPRRRIRQHNGEISQGAAKTRRWRPWTMVLVVHGFPSQTQGLQFEWAWQHPEKSLDVRDAAARLGRKGRYGIKGKIALLMEMLNTDPWCYFPLTVQFLESEFSTLRAGCSDPPDHVQVLVAPLEDIVINKQQASQQQHMEDDDNDYDDDISIMPTQSDMQQQVSMSQMTTDSKRQKAIVSTCTVCSKAANRTWFTCTCGKRYHVGCLARHFLIAEGHHSAGTLPTSGKCPECSITMEWQTVLSSIENVGWAQHKKQRAGKTAAANGEVSQKPARGRKKTTTATKTAATGVAAQQQQEKQEGKTKLWDVSSLSSDSDDGIDDGDYNFDPEPWENFDQVGNSQPDASVPPTVDLQQRQNHDASSPLSDILEVPLMQRLESSTFQAQEPPQTEYRATVPVSSSPEVINLITPETVKKKLDDDDEVIVIDSD